MDKLVTPKEILRENNGALVVLDDGETYLHFLGNLMDGERTIPLDDYDDYLNARCKIKNVIKIYSPTTKGEITFCEKDRTMMWQRPKTKKPDNKLQRKDCESFSHYIFRQAINKYGLRNQMTKTVEELSELSQALCKSLIRLDDAERTKDFTTTSDLESIDNIFEEMADVTIMLSQCQMMFQCEAEVNKWIDKKIQRLAERLGKCT